MFACSTTRLILRDFVEDDWQAIYALSQAPAVTCYQSWLRLADPIEAQQWVQRAIHHNQLQPREVYNLAVVEREYQAVIGWLGWGRPSDRMRGDYDFGYALLPGVWGRGYMTEALQAAIDYMFEPLEARLVYGECASRNRASARVMEKCGLTLVAQWDERDPTTGAGETHQRYAIGVGEWRQRRSASGPRS